MTRPQGSLVALVTTLLLSACGGGGGGSDSPAPPPQVQSPAGPDCLFNATRPGCTPSADAAPYVIYSSRSNGTVDAAVNTDILAGMSEPLDPASVNASTITLTGDDGVTVTGTTEYDAGGPTLVFRPAADLVRQRYTATINAGIRDASGKAMGRPYSWSFTVDGARRDTPDQRAIQKILDKAAYTFRIPGSIIAVRDNRGRTWATTNGYADLAMRVPMRTDMVFRMGSNTKTFVSTIVLQLADAGKLGLDDPVNRFLATEMAQYLPAYDGNRITLRHLLGHTSGIANFTTDPTWGQAFISDPTKQYFPQELLMIANSHAADPGAPTFGNFFYSNTNYILLAMVIRKASGMVYEDAVANAITLPWNLPHTVVPLIGENTMQPPFSRGYWEDTETGTLHDVTLRDSSTVWSSGNLITTIGDLARWGELLGKGTTISSTMQNQRLRFVPMGEHVPALSYGLGIVRDGTANLLGHQGGMIGYTSQMYYVPDKGYTLAFFYNRTLSMPDYSAVMTYDALNVLWPGRVPTAAANQIKSQPPAPSPHRIPGFLTEY